MYLFHPPYIIDWLHTIVKLCVQKHVLLWYWLEEAAWYLFFCKQLNFWIVSSTTTELLSHTCVSVIKNQSTGETRETLLKFTSILFSETPITQHDYYEY